MKSKRAEALFCSSLSLHKLRKNTNEAHVYIHVSPSLEDITFPVTKNIQVFSFSSLFYLKCN